MKEPTPEPTPDAASSTWRRPELIVYGRVKRVTAANSYFAGDGFQNITPP
jgi:hypothetical protein